MFMSMTGFGRAAQSFPWGNLTFEISSVNHRYQEINVRLPKEMSSLESPIVASLRSSLRRGKIRLSAEIVWADEYNTAKLNADALRSYYTQLNEIACQMGAQPVSDLAAFLALPGVCDSPRVSGYEDGALGEPAGNFWTEPLTAAVDAMIEMKRSEGAKLEAVIDKDLAEFERLTRSLSERWDIASSEAIEALRSRVEKIMEHFSAEADQNRVAQEMSLLADKWDVAEELARLSSHISKFREIKSGKESEGRKLDFLIQEMNREVNTMGSKVGDADFRWTIVEAKSCLERIREQIQNVE